MSEMISLATSDIILPPLGRPPTTLTINQPVLRAVNVRGARTGKGQRRWQWDWASSPAAVSTHRSPLRAGIRGVPGRSTPPTGACWPSWPPRFLRRRMHLRSLGRPHYAFAHPRASSGRRGTLWPTACRARPPHPSSALAGRRGLGARPRAKRASAVKPCRSQRQSPLRPPTCDPGWSTRPVDSALSSGPMWHCGSSWARPAPRALRPHQEAGAPQTPRTSKARFPRRVPCSSSPAGPSRASWSMLLICTPPRRPWCPASAMTRRRTSCARCAGALGPGYLSNRCCMSERPPASTSTTTSWPSCSPTARKTR